MINPISTYRLQFHKDFTFDDLETIIPYLDKLGVRTIYASPIFKAAAGSNHGYDAVNPHLINPEIGTETQLRTVSQQLTDRGIGWLQDIVPNHMAFDPSNDWLMDVLEKGQQSLYAPFFDITWSSPVHQGRVMVPFLGSPLDEIIDKGDLKVDYQAGKLVLAYFDSAYPLHLRSYPTLLQQSGRESSEGLAELVAQIPDILATDDARTYALRTAEFQTRLAALLDETGAMATLKGNLEAVSKQPDQIRQIAGEQAYELCYHAETDARINYRRFFTVNGLICLNIQDPAVFSHFHERIQTLMDGDVFQGLRVDHIDGLYDPVAYMQQLRELAGENAYIVVEKILQANEELPSQWPVQGSTGYAYLSMVNNLFTRTDSEASFTRFYRKLLGERVSVREELRSKKAYILYEHMGGELDNLYHRLLSLNLIEDEQLATLSPDTLKKGIGEFLIHCPVYRYYGNSLPLDADEADAVRGMLDKIRRVTPELSEAADILEEVLLVKPLTGDDDYNSRALRFYQRCMQFTGPLMAKGAEDTLMYTYTRFIGHDEVGDSPDYFGLTTDEFHQKMLTRCKQWPLALNATSTHDTKRGEDVRSRLNVLTDLTDEWIEAVEAWQQLNKTDNPRPTVDTENQQFGNDETGTTEAPDVNDEYFIYQTLIGSYPMPGQDEDNFPDRLREYLQKAMREAKRHTTYNAPNEAYEEATQTFAARLLDAKRPFWENFQKFHQRICDFGIVNSLAQVVLKCTCPGLPDIYQGCEFWDLSLVDPDNRRPVDFDRRQRSLDDMIACQCDTEEFWQDLWQHRYDARLKQWLIYTLLNERKRQNTLFAEGDYIPLAVEGTHQKHVLAFARQHQDTWYVVAVPLGLARLCRDQQVDVSSPDWADTHLVLPAGAPSNWQHRLLKMSGRGEGRITISEIFKAMPLAVLKLEA